MFLLFRCQFDDCMSPPCQFYNTGTTTGPFRDMYTEAAKNGLGFVGFGFS